MGMFDGFPIMFGMGHSNHVIDKTTLIKPNGNQLKASFALLKLIDSVIGLKQRRNVIVSYVRNIGLNTNLPGPDSANQNNEYTAGQ